MPLPTSLARLARLLPEEHVGRVTAVHPISNGLSGAAIYAVSSTGGELVLRVNPDGGDTSRLGAAGSGVAPRSRARNRSGDRHVDRRRARSSPRARRGVPLVSALMDPWQRGPAIAGVVEQLRTLHTIDLVGVEPRDPLAQACELYAAQRQRRAFPIWAAALDPVFDSIERALARDPRRVVSHNDLNPSNVLWDGARVWLVDWEVAGLGHPFYDLAVLAMFVQLDDAAAHELLAQQEQQTMDDRARYLRRAATAGGAPLRAGPRELGAHLSLTPASTPNLSAFYAALRAGTLDLRDARGRVAFALALLQLGAAGEGARPARTAGGVS